MEQGPIPPVPPVPTAQTQSQPQTDTTEVAGASRPEPGPSPTSQSGYSDHGTQERRVRLPTASIKQPFPSPYSDIHASQTHFRDDSHADSHHVSARPPSTRKWASTDFPPPRQGSSVGLPTVAVQNTSELDWIVPLENVDPGGYPHTSRSHPRQHWFTKLFSRRTVARIVPLEEEKVMPLTIRRRLKPTMENIILQREKFARKARLHGYLINLAIALQVLLGALTTGLAAAVTTVKQGQISTAILGGLATLVASFLARVRGSGEPELSIIRKKDLDHLLRDAYVLDMDHGHEEAHPENGLDARLQELRDRLEELLRKANDGGKKLPPVPPNATSNAKAASAANQP